MANNVIATKRALTEVDKVIRTPNEVELSGRRLIRPIAINSGRRYYDYKMAKSTGTAVLHNDGQTDTPVVDTTLTEESARIVEYSSALEYTESELEMAAEEGFDVLRARSVQVRRALAEMENRIIFNGINANTGKEEDNLIGLTTDSKISHFQEATAPIKFADTVENESGSNQIRNWLQDVADMITTQPGFNNSKPVLLLPTKAVSYINRPFNKYNIGTTVKSLLSEFFQRVEAIPELGSKYTAQQQDMGIVLMNTEDVVGYPVAKTATPYPAVQKQGGTIMQEYYQRTGGLVAYHPEAIVQLKGI